MSSSNLKNDTFSNTSSMIKISLRAANPLDRYFSGSQRILSLFICIQNPHSKCDYKVSSDSIESRELAVTYLTIICGGCSRLLKAYVKAVEVGEESRRLKKLRRS